MSHVALLSGDDHHAALRHMGWTVTSGIGGVLAILGAPIAFFFAALEGSDPAGYAGLMMAVVGIVVANVGEWKATAPVRAEREYLATLALIYDGDVPPRLEEES